MTREHVREIAVAFASGAIEGEPLRVWRARGKERLSSLFRYDVDLLAPASPLTERQQQAVVSSPCALALGAGPTDVVHGVVDHLVAMEPPAHLAEQTSAVYRVRIVPTVSLLTRAERSRTFESATVHDVVTDILGSYGLLRGTDYDLLLEPSGPQPALRQERESDWSFIERRLAHEGYFYWFDQQGAGERLVIAESNADATHLGGAPIELWDVSVTTRRTPARVAVMGTDRGAEVVLARQDVDHPTGFGTVFDYSEPASSVERAAHLAKRRADGLRAQGRVLRASSHSPRLRAGHRFELSYEAVSNVDGAYLITGAHLRYEDGVTTVRIQAIPFDVTYRPRLKSRWPVHAPPTTPHVLSSETEQHPTREGIRVELQPLRPRTA